MLRWNHFGNDLLRRFHMSENSMLIAIAVVLGLGTGSGVVLFRETFQFFEYVAVDVIGANGFLGHWLSSIGLPPELSVLLVLTVGGAIVGLIVQLFIGHERHHGVAAVMESVALAGGRLPYGKVLFKTLASALSLGVGASVGPEDPSVQIGANLGSFFGEKLQLSEERVQLLVASGSAAAIGTAFNAPIAGVFFALEVVLGEFTTRSFGVVVLASVIASSTARFMTGGNPIFGNLKYKLGNYGQLPFYVLLGLVLAVGSVVMIRFFYWQSDFWHHKVNVSPPIKTALTGTIVASVGIFLPQILGPGEDTMQLVLTGEAKATFILLLLIGFGKLAMTAVSQGGGFQGGVFAPVLFIGTMFGSAYGHFLNLLLPSSVVGGPQNFAIAGMAGLLAGVVRAPITAILLVFELTDDYLLILPIMLTAVVCVLIVERIGTPGIYMQSLINKGVYLQQGRDVDVMQGIAVREAMQSPAATISESASLSELRAKFLETHTRSLCVLNEKGDLAGIVTLGDLQRSFEGALQDGNKAVEEYTVGDIATKDVITVEANDMLWTAIRNMGARDVGRLPVIDRSGKVIGMLRRHDIMNAYNTAVSRKLQDQHFAEQIRLHTLTGAHVLEFTVQPNTDIAGKLIKEVQWPPDALVASVLRKGKLIVPHGDTKLYPGDRVTVVSDVHAESIIEDMFEKPSRVAL